MLTIDPRAAEKIQPELLSGESIHWAAMPNPNKIFHSDDWFVIPFSLMWGGFAIFWEVSALGYWGKPSQSHAAPGFFALWGIPFVLMGQYFIWGRFLYDAWLKRRTFYAATNRRVLILQEGWNRRTQFSFLESIPEISREGADVGTLWLAAKLPTFGGRGTKTRGLSRISITDGVPTLADIDNLDAVYRLILELREKTRKQSSQFNTSPLS